jgi:uncharacterized membrane protein
MHIRQVSTLGLAIVILIITAAILASVYGSLQSDFLTAVQNTVLLLLNVTVNALYLLGAGLIILGSILVTIRYVRAKLKDPTQPFAGVARARYLTLSLEFFIGAEIIKTVIVRTYEEFLLLIFVIISRGLFSLILYLDHRWHKAAETK